MAASMSKGVITRCLSGVPLFSELSDDEMEMLASSARSTTSKKGARVFEEGAPADFCFVLTAGKARVLLSGENGAEILLGIVMPANLVGEVALLDGSTRSASLVAVEDCHFIRIPAAAFDNLRKNATFERRLVAHVVYILREANDQVRGISTFPSIGRVAWCLGRIARQEGERDGKSVVIPNKPHHELAEMTGCTRETVSRALGALKRKKYVSWNRQTMRLEIEGLQRYLGGEPLGPPARWM